MDQQLIDARCGVGCWRPGCLRHLANIKAYIATYSMASLVTASLSVYIVSQVTTIEKQFGLTSSESGRLLACNDIGYSVCILFAGYFAQHVHIPRVLCLSTIMYGISGILCALPHFISRTATVHELPEQLNASRSILPSLGLCVPTVLELKSSDELKPVSTTMTNGSPNTVDEYEEERMKTVSFVLIAAGMICQGFAKAPRYPMNAQFVDDNTKQENTGFYMGIITTVAIAGPAVAFGLGGLFSQIYVSLKDVDLHPRDPRWIGAWWLGFLIFGVAAIIVALPLLCFPRSLVAHADRGRHIFSVDRGRDKTDVSKKGVCCLFLGKAIKGVVRSVIHIARTPEYSLTLLGSTLNVMVMSAAMAFGPKYIEEQFKVPAWHANILLAVIGLVSTGIGTFLGGLLTNKMRMTPRNCLGVLLGCHVFSATCTLVSMLLSCKQPVIQNWSPDNSSSLSAQACSSHCRCDDHQFLPICGADGNSYFSPCHAGCTDGQIQWFSNCTCIPGGRARSGFCMDDCASMWPWAAVTFVGGVAGSVVIMPTFILFLRSVPQRYKSMAIGISALISSLLGWVPGPVIGGRLVDTTCILWGREGSCSYYDIDQLRYSLYGLILSFKGLSLLIFAGTLFVVWNMKAWRSEQEPAAVVYVEKQNSLERTSEFAVNGFKPEKEPPENGVELSELLLVNGRKPALPENGLERESEHLINGPKPGQETRESELQSREFRQKRQETDLILKANGREPESETLMNDYNTR